MLRAFNYDALKLIELVKGKPCLWDRSQKNFRYKSERDSAWKEICIALEKDFLEKSPEEQEKICKVVSKKWQNTRDSFTKSLKKKSGLPATKQYLYHDLLTFLLKHTDDTQSTADDSLQDDQSSRSETEEERSDVEIEVKVSRTSDDETEDESRDVDRKPLKILDRRNDQDETAKKTVSARRSRSQDGAEKKSSESRRDPTAKSKAVVSKRIRLQDFVDREASKSRHDKDSIDDETIASKRARLQDNDDREIVKTLESRCDQDEAFFISITPIVRKMSDDEKLEFRMNVLQTIWEITKRRNNNQPQTSISSS